MQLVSRVQIDPAVILVDVRQKMVDCLSYYDFQIQAKCNPELRPVDRREVTRQRKA